MAPAILQGILLYCRQAWGYGMYTLVLPFFAWMIVLVVSTIECKSLAASLDVAVVSTYVGLPVQAVYSNGYIQIKQLRKAMHSCHLWKSAELVQL